MILFERAMAYVLVAAGAAMVWLGGCSYTTGEHTLALLQLAPTESISTRTVTVIGAEIQPSTAAMRVGYVRSVENSTPVGDATAPDMTIKTQFEKDGAITESFSVGQLQ